MQTVLVMLCWLCWVVAGMYAWKKYCDRGHLIRESDAELFSMIFVVLMGPVCLIINKAVSREDNDT